MTEPMLLRAPHCTIRVWISGIAFFQVDTLGTTSSSYSQNKPKAVQTGSTNWSDTGICAQSNNTIIIDSEEIASFYFDYWQRLREQGNSQGTTFRSENNTPRTATVDNNDVTLWFSPRVSLMK